VELQIEFTSRKPGSFGLSPFGRTLEWVTRTWLRFTCFLFSAGIALIALSSPMPVSEKFVLIVFAPVAALVYWYMFLFLLLICRYLGRFGRVFAHVLIIYFFLFSRLVVQPPPKVWLPLISDR
jgi:hypothetical protein